MADATLAAARAAIPPLYREAETAVLERLVPAASLDPAERARVLAQAARAARRACARRAGRAGSIGSCRNTACPARRARPCSAWPKPICACPTPLTADALIRDKLGRGDWRAHLGAADSVVVNSATLGLILAQSLAEARGRRSLRAPGRAHGRAGDPRRRSPAAMQRMGEAFVLGRDIDEALQAAPTAGPTAPSAIPSTCWARRRARPPTPRPISQPTSRRIAAVGERGEARADVFGARQRLGEALRPAPALRAAAGRPRACPNSPAS